MSILISPPFPVLRVFVIIPELESENSIVLALTCISLPIPEERLLLNINAPSSINNLLAEINKFVPSPEALFAICKKKALLEDNSKFSLVFILILLPLP